MDDIKADAPARWVEELARSDADIAAGRLVPARVVHERLRAAILELEADMAADSEVSAAHSTGH